MRILAFSHTGLVTGGAEQCLIEYVSLLSSRGHTCEVLMPHEGPMQTAFNDKGIENKVIGYGWATRPFKEVSPHELLSSTGGSLTRIFQEVERFKPDVILVNTSVLPWGLYAGRIFSIPTVLLAHEILSDKDPSLNALPNYEAYLDVLNQYTDVIVYNSEFVKTEFNKGLIKPITPEKILYPLPPLSKEDIERLEKKNVIEEKLLIAIFGALAPRKNQLEALKAANILKQKGIKDFTIHMYGDVAANLPYVGELKRYIKDNNLGDIVEIKGYATAVYETMNSYNAILSTSTYEPFGRTVVEGQLFGRIALANNTGGGTELIENGKTGLIYELGSPESLASQIEWILNNKEDALNIGAVAKRTQIKKFLTAERYDPLIEAVEVLSKKAQLTQEDYFNPIRSLYEYVHVLNKRYEKIDKIVNNRMTRSAKHVYVRSKAKAKRMVKEILAKR